MSQTITSASRWLDWAVCLFLLSVGGSIATFQGQDATWDFRAYHLYNGWAALHSRLQIDVAPAGPHTFINPISDVVAYTLFSISPLVGTTLLGAWFGLGLFFLYRCGILLLKGVTDDQTWTRSIVAVLAAFSGFGAMAVSLTGNTSGESQLIPFLTGAALLGCWASETLHPARQILLYGALAFWLGFAVGLKFTAGSYAVGGLSVLIALHAANRHWAIAMALALGAAGGFLLTYGWWGWTLYRDFGSPVFPMFNDIFQSPFARPERFDISSMGHVPFVEAVLAPLKWAYGIPANSEAPFRDARTLSGLIACLLILITAFIGRDTSKQGRVLFVWALCYLTCFVVWAAVFKAARYATGFEVIGSFIAGFVIVRFLTHAHVSKITMSVVLLTVALLAFFSTDWPLWGRIPFDRTIVRYPKLLIPDGSLVLLIDRPNKSNQLTHLIPAIGPRATFAQPAGLLLKPNDGSILSSRIKNLVARAPHIFILSYRDRDRDFATNVTEALSLCLQGDPTFFSTSLSGEVIMFSKSGRC